MSRRPTPPSLVVLKKELIDGVRDLRSLFSAFFFPLLGPLTIGLVAINIPPPLTPSRRFVTVSSRCCCGCPTTFWSEAPAVSPPWWS